MASSTTTDNITSDPRWQALHQRDARAVGTFFYGVITTAIYCRPNCPSRLPKPENVRFFPTSDAAQVAGFRPCKRCHPEQAAADAALAKRVADLCRFIETAAYEPSLDELAAHAGLSKYHLHRLFKQATGVTPKAYAKAHRSKRVQQQLTQQASVTGAIYDAGYHSNSRFYAEANQLLGMTPGDYRAGGIHMTIYFAIGESSLGAILVAQSQRGVCAILLGDDAQLLIQDLQDRFPSANLIGGDQQFEILVARVVGFVEAPQQRFDLPLDIRGTAFQQRVWQALQQIPAGETRSYRDIAEQIGSPNAVRAVAGACAANAIAVVIPCHRVVRNDGNLSGYRWGVERKRDLLQREAVGNKETQ